MLTVGVVGDDQVGAASRLTSLSTATAGVTIVMQPGIDVRAKCQFVVGVGSATSETEWSTADVWIVDANDIDELWRNRLVPFESNLTSGRRARRNQPAVLSDPDRTWPVQARRLIERLASAIGDRVIRIDHIGSTSVPGLRAKNLLDVQVVVADLGDAALIADAGRSAGFVHVPGPQWCQDRHGTEHPEEVVVDADPGRPVNVNIRAVTAPIWRETLLFRDWLRSTETARADYLAIKRELATRDDGNVNTYGVAKIPWISAAGREAEEWAKSKHWVP